MARPIWLAKFEVVKEELRHTRFPRTAEEGVLETAALSAAAKRMMGATPRAKRGRGRQAR